MDLPVSRAIRHAHHAAESVTLTYDARFLRRKVLHTDDGQRFLVDLGQTTSVNSGDAFELDGGRLVRAVPAPEELLEVTGTDLARFATDLRIPNEAGLPFDQVLGIEKQLKNALSRLMDFDGMLELHG